MGQLSHVIDKLNREELEMEMLLKTSWFYEWAQATYAPRWLGRSNLEHWEKQPVGAQEGTPFPFLVQILFPKCQKEQTASDFPTSGVSCFSDPLLYNSHVLGAIHSHQNPGRGGLLLFLFRGGN